jgi:Family of unknown function (DUF5898)
MQHTSRFHTGQRLLDSCKTHHYPESYDMPCSDQEPKCLRIQNHPIGENQLELLQPKSRDTTHLGMGAHGNCCLAVSSTGESCCAIKFFHQPGVFGEYVRYECDNWNKVYGGKNGFPQCQVLRIAEGYCLVMPYLHPIPKSERHKRIEDQSVYKALQLFSRSGFVHPDIQWRHIGLWNNEVGLDEVRLLDFRTLVEEHDEKKRAAWCDEAIKTLSERSNLLSC